MALVVVDTDVLIGFLRGHEPEAGWVEAALRHGLATTTLNAFELWSGCIGSSRREHAVDCLLQVTQMLPLDAESAHSAAEVRRHLERKGQTIGTADSLIAGICLKNRASLATLNTDHFRRVTGLRLESLSRS